MYLQIVEQIRHRIAAGALQADDELPSVRALASEHLINPNTVARAYLELEREGLLAKRRGAGTYVSTNATALTANHRVQAVRELLDKALSAAAEFGLTTEQVRELVEERLSAAKEKSA
jgi:GntR family transcriptional regulator